MESPKLTAEEVIALLTPLMERPQDSELTTVMNATLHTLRDICVEHLPEASVGLIECHTLGNGQFNLNAAMKEYRTDNPEAKIRQARVVVMRGWAKFVKENKRG